MLSTHFPTHSIGLTSSSRPSTNSTGDGSAYGPPGAPGPSGAADHLSAPPGLPSISPFSTRPNSSHGCPGSPMDRPTLPPLSSLSRPGTAGGAGGRGDEPLAVGIGATGAAAGGGGRNSISGLAGGVGGDAAIRLPSSRANSLSFGNRLPSRSGPRGDALDFHTASSSFALMNKSPAFASGPVFGGSVAGAVLEKDRLPSRGGLPVGFLGMGGTADRSRARGSAGGNVNGIATGTGAAPSSSVRTSPDDSLFQFHPPPLDRVRDDRDLKRPTDDMNDGRAHKRFATMGDAPSCGEVVAAAGGSGGGGSGLGGGRPPSRRVSIADLCGPSNGDADEADVEDALAGVGGARS
ncbi:hypothetical protein K437DRAFT_263686 [Tilletiaria anomala UBC 951]|uniref:Uncharacterized protein n=1 Tax=Tilletiaria anomala (strain ATCC 24038 / CBS 436.72 / UBC 951) TaxID=1037660 RepID=A0A066VR11_TILAU|nr:uncharacterized protein K437DRAFT_263686 [Tilletiaria anomala UBC 951]KDN42713.1 hypothetical protein K437DRAFT_263686 [Tilletiaria anomala UBC 951]